MEEALLSATHMVREKQKENKPYIYFSISSFLIIVYHFICFGAEREKLLRKKILVIAYGTAAVSICAQIYKSVTFFLASV